MKGISYDISYDINIDCKNIQQVCTPSAVQPVNQRFVEKLSTAKESKGPHICILHDVRYYYKLRVWSTDVMAA